MPKQSTQILSALTIAFCCTFPLSGLCSDNTIDDSKLAAIRSAIQQANTLDYQGSTNIAFEKSFAIHSPVINMDRVIRFNPAKRTDKQWQLIKENGATPTKEQMHEYSKVTVPDFVREQHQKKQAGLLHPLLPYIDWNSLQPKIQSSQKHVFTFGLTNRDDAEHLLGELTFRDDSDDGIWLSSVNITSPESFKSSWFGPSINYQAHYQFNQVSLDSKHKPAVLLEHMTEDVHIDFGIKEMTSSKQEHYRNFELPYAKKRLKTSKLPGY